MSQSDLILKSLKSGERITPIDALNKFGCFRLSARIHDLRDRGFDVRKSMLKTANNKVVAQYYLLQTELF